MKWIFSLCALSFLACDCKNEVSPPKDDKLAELRIHLEERLKAIDPANRIDSFKLVSMDTLTQRDKYGLLKEAFTDSLDRMKLRMEVYGELYNANLRLMNLSRKRSSQEYNTYKSEAEENKTELEKIDSVSKHLESQSLYYDSLLNFDAGTRAIGYRAVCMYQLRRKDRSVLIDTGSILMNLDKNILRKEDFIKLP